MTTTDSIDDPPPPSTNERAERIMGRRLTPEQESAGVIAIDYPVELGYQCPIHRRNMAHAEGRWDGLLEWSEYRAFLWCPECDRDWPSAMCVPLDNPEESRFDRNAGPDDAIEIFLDTVEGATAALRAERDQMAALLVFLNTLTHWASEDPEDKALMERLIEEAENDEGPDL